MIKSKKIMLAVIAALMVIMMMLSSLSVFAAGEEIAYNPGDINGDGKVNINDATEYQFILSGNRETNPYFEKNSNTYIDVKNTTSKNADDITAIQLFLAKTYRDLPVSSEGYYTRIIQPE